MVTPANNSVFPTRLKERPHSDDGVSRRIGMPVVTTTCYQKDTDPITTASSFRTISSCYETSALCALRMSNVISISLRDLVINRSSIGTLEVSMFARTPSVRGSHIFDKHTNLTYPGLWNDDLG